MCDALLAGVFSRQLLEDLLIFILSRGALLAARTDNADNYHRDHGDDQDSGNRDQYHHAVLLKEISVAEAYARHHFLERGGILCGNVAAVAVHGDIHAFSVHNRVGKQTLAVVDICIKLDPADIPSRRIHAAGGIRGIAQKALGDFAELFRGEQIIVAEALALGGFRHRDGHGQRGVAVHTLQINMVGLKILHGCGVVLTEGGEIAVTLLRVPRDGVQLSGNGDRHLTDLRQIITLSKGKRRRRGACGDQRARPHSRDSM